MARRSIMQNEICIVYTECRHEMSGIYRQVDDERRARKARSRITFCTARCASLSASVNFVAANYLSNSRTRVQSSASEMPTGIPNFPPWHIFLTCEHLTLPHDIFQRLPSQGGERSLRGWVGLLTAKVIQSLLGRCE